MGADISRDRRPVEGTNTSSLLVINVINRRNNGAPLSELSGKL
jgi:hypothetical protein